ncbi:MAG: alpha/beta hydrolase [Bacteroidota bacterium]
MEPDLIESGNASFRTEVPYHLYRTGTEGNDKPRPPLLVYLHGFHQTAARFEELCSPLLKQVNAYHLVVNGPYVLYPRKQKKPVQEWGRAWYLYDGNQEQFLRSMDRSSRFLEQLIQKTIRITGSNRTGLIGYSMGGYLAGYHAIQHAQQVDDLVVCGARIKTELLNGDYKKVFHQNILALHGNADKQVEAMPQKAVIMGLKEEGIRATFETVDGDHKFSSAYVGKILDWLNKVGYNSNSF